MPILFHEDTLTFHLYNDSLSYIMKVLSNGQLGSIYFGGRLNDKADFGYLIQTKATSGSMVLTAPEKGELPLDHLRQEYPAYGTGDFHYPVYRIIRENGSPISDYRYAGHNVFRGKKGLEGLPATYTENDDEAETLEISLRDDLTGGELVLSYSIFEEISAIARSVRFINNGSERLTVDSLMSASVDFTDGDFDMITLNGSWCRERHVRQWRLHEGVQEVYSSRGISSAEHNPFFALKRPNADESSGEVYGFSLIYSGNHRELCELDNFGMLRCSIGIEPEHFSWIVGAGESFTSPEAVIVYSDKGLGAMSQTFHKLFRTRLVRGKWRYLERPVLFNSWEATMMDFTEDKLLKMARESKRLGVDLFVLDDGWFGERCDDHRGLGDWHVVNKKKFPNGIEAFSRSIKCIGLDFGIWIEPEMINEDSDLFRAHPDWVIHTPGRYMSTSRNQLVLDLSRKEVVDYLFDTLSRLFELAEVTYIKWDMNRSISEFYCNERGAEDQGRNFHAYVLGVYDLYERLIARFPEVLFESCASGGGRFDPGMLYYAPQTWTSDCTDAIERLRIQYGTSFVYPVSSMGAHVSAIPNQQNGRCTPLNTRFNVACFGVLGYELDPLALTEGERDQIVAQISAYKKYRSLIQKGVFYRLSDPETGSAALMIVSDDKAEALVGFYRTRTMTNPGWEYLKLRGLDTGRRYEVSGYCSTCYGDELMRIGLLLHPVLEKLPQEEYSSMLIHLKTVD